MREKQELGKVSTGCYPASTLSVAEFSRETRWEPASLKGLLERQRELIRQVSPACSPALPQESDSLAPTLPGTG